jgi:hypothetical protein
MGLWVLAFYFFHSPPYFTTFLLYIHNLEYGPLYGPLTVVYIFLIYYCELFLVIVDIYLR